MSPNAIINAIDSSVITAEVLQQSLNDPDWVIVDCRYDLMDHGKGERQYLESHIAHAVYADLAKDLSIPARKDLGRHPLPSPQRLNSLISSLGIGHETQVVVYDDAAGSIAARLWWILKYMGHDAVAVLDGGWQVWEGAVEGGKTVNPGKGFRGKPREELLVRMDAVLEAKLLIDSREPQRYRGDFEPIDPVAGHIPGAVNYYWKANLDKSGRFLGSKRIRGQLQVLYADISAETAVFYCGSGVTACHNVLATVYAGLPMPRLYVGSWSEWCRQQNCTVVTEGKADLNNR